MIDACIEMLLRFILNLQVKIYNDIVKLRLINPTGLIKGIAYKDIHNVLEHEFKDHERGSPPIT